MRMREEDEEAESSAPADLDLAPADDWAVEMPQWRLVANGRVRVLSHSRRRHSGAGSRRADHSERGGEIAQTPT